MSPVAEGSQSPDNYERTPSPDVDHHGHDAPGPSKKARLSMHDVQKYKLERLLANPDKEYKIPVNQPKTLRPPKEMPKNVTGSSSAAGSGEFHVYKHSRRREFERLKIMEEQAVAVDEQTAFQERQAARDAVTDAKTSKNRARRQKRKAAVRGGGGGGGAGGDDKSAGPTAAPALAAGKGKFAGGAGSVAFRRPGEEAEDDEGGEGGEAPGPVPPAAAVSASATIASSAPPPAAVAEVQITIVDDD